MRRQRGDELFQKVPFEVAGWRGRVSDMSKSVFSTTEATFAVNVGYSQLRGSIPYSDPRFEKIKQLGKEDEVRFSEHFKSANRDRVDCFSEYSMTERGSMDNPYYSFEFTEIQPVK